ncbi:alpha/beta hydrolase [Spirosoma rhododendri]|uniref:Phospholipase n=1 Tax=Spirosoma rhododendri TaxID=2728024 RepID=A0A7L5DML1_9BACT|nr:phospholipase [Spirosoma rhododendri]QJD78772.1 phospholipase [Spirosoma rhododendri]
MTEHHLTVARTARYYTLGKFSEHTRNVWFCLHGFGQLASYFGRKFTGLPDEQTVVVVPEGLSRLYLDNTYTRIGASWLTREDRDAEISDFVSYLNTLYDQLLTPHSSAPLHITLLGFSQGAATACRWIDNGHIRVDRLILWAGFFPNGLTDIINPARLAGLETHYVYGLQDELLQRLPDTDTYIDRLKADVPNLLVTTYDGGHRVEPAVLNTLLA